MPDQLGSNIVFLISQPRAGSTLLQRILGGHSDIHTQSEPWLMLYPLKPLINIEDTPTYENLLLYKAVKEFITSLPGEEEDYYEGIRRMYSFLYERARESTGKKYFLDKTPRYYLIIPLLSRIFPKARFIILLRNPLAVFNSILRTWTVFFLYRFRSDLLAAPNLLIEGARILKNRCFVVNYESLVIEPDEVTKNICNWLEISYEPNIVNYQQQLKTEWNFGDKVTVHRKAFPVSQSLDKWIHGLRNAHTWRLTENYLKEIGVQTIQSMGYSHDELQQILFEHRPNRILISVTFSLEWYLRRPIIEFAGLRWYLARMTKSIESRGLRKTFELGLRNFRSRFSFLSNLV